MVVVVQDADARLLGGGRDQGVGERDAVVARGDFRKRSEGANRGALHGDRHWDIAQQGLVGLDGAELVSGAGAVKQFERDDRAGRDRAGAQRLGPRLAQVRVVRALPDRGVRDQDVAAEGGRSRLQAPGLTVDVAEQVAVVAGVVAGAARDQGLERRCVIAALSEQCVGAADGEIVHERGGLDAGRHERGDALERGGQLRILGHRYAVVARGHASAQCNTLVCHSPRIRCRA